MKKITKLLVTLLLLFVFASAPVMAMSSNYNESYSENLIRRDDLIVNAIKNGESNIEKLIKDNFTADDLKIPKVEKIETIRTEKIDNTLVTFKNDGTFYIGTIKEERSPFELKNADYNTNLRSAAQYKTAGSLYRS